MAASIRWTSTVRPASRCWTPLRSRSSAWRPLMRPFRPRSAAIRICSSLRALGSSARATRSSPSSRAGMAERYAVIGNPIAHSRSPEIHAVFARASGHDIEYARIEAPLDGFDSAVAAFRAAGGRGLNVTLPFKQAAFRYCDELADRAGRAQAVNTLVFGERVRGDNTDGIGLV